MLTHRYTRERARSTQRISLALMMEESVCQVSASRETSRIKQQWENRFTCKVQFKTPQTLDLLQSNPASQAEL